MFDSLKKFLIKSVSKEPVYREPPKPKGYINWDVVGNDVDNLLKYLRKKTSG